jgi:hypothetical protein
MLKHTSNVIHLYRSDLKEEFKNKKFDFIYGVKTECKLEYFNISEEEIEWAHRIVFMNAESNKKIGELAERGIFTNGCALKKHKGPNENWL